MSDPTIKDVYDIVVDLRERLDLSTMSKDQAQWISVPEAAKRMGMCQETLHDRIKEIAGEKRSCFVHDVEFRKFRKRWKAYLPHIGRE